MIVATQKRIKFIIYLRFHTQLLNTIQQKLIQRSPFSEPNSGHCVTRVFIINPNYTFIIHLNSIYNKSELGHVAQTIKLTIEFDFMLLYRLLPKRGHIVINQVGRCI